MNNDDEIIIGINKAQTPKKKSKKSKNKKQSKQIVKKDSIKEKKVARIATSTKHKNKDKPAKKTSKAFIIFLLIWVLALVVFVLMNLNICKIQKVELVNSSRVTEDIVKELANFDQYNNLFSLNTMKAEEDIKKNAYVEDVKVSRKFPNTVKVTLKERVPRFMLQVADSYVYINNQGYMVDVTVDKLDVPIILGFKTDLSNAKPGDRLILDDLKQMETIIRIVETANMNEIGAYITKIDVSNDKNYALILESEQKTVYLGDCSDLNTRMLYLSGILTQTRGLAGEIFLNMDLNTDDAYFREQT